MTLSATRTLLAAAVLSSLAPLSARSQAPADSARRTPRADSTATPAPAPADTSAKAHAPARPAQPPAFDFSGVLYTNFQYGGLPGNRSQNRFDVDRAYLTFRGTAGERASYRVTADIFQQRDDTKNAYYGGWVYRLKYAYGQYDFIGGAGDGLKANARVGMLHTPIIDYEEQFWPRGLAQVAVEQAGFFSSADLGAATLVTLPNKFGEFYATVVNGNGYTQRETDRFKDYGGRLTLTPFGASHGIGRTFAITPWYYKGTRASDFVTGRGTVLPVSDGRRKDRYGVHVGIRDPRITIGTQVAWRNDDVEAADTTLSTIPAIAHRHGRVLSAYTVVKPFSFVGATPLSPLNLVFRFDRVKPDDNRDAYQRQFISGLGWDLSKRATLYADAQVQQPRDGSNAPDLRTYFLHAIVNF